MHAPVKYVEKYITANRYDRLEWAGDLGTRLPLPVLGVVLRKGYVKL